MRPSFATRLISRAMLLAGALVVAAPAQAQDPTPDPVCAYGEPSFSREACDVLRVNLSLAHFGLEPIQTLAESGTQGFRAMWVDAWGRPYQIISTLRPAGQPPQIQVHFGYGETAAFSEPIAEQIWRDIARTGETFDRQITPLPPDDPGRIMVCADGHTAHVEAIDANGTIRRSRGSGCDATTHRAPSLAWNFAEHMERIAAQNLVRCSSLDLGYAAIPRDILSYCSILTGDTTAAGIVASAFFESRFEFPNGIRFLPTGRLIWLDGTQHNGERAISAFLTEQVWTIGSTTIIGNSADSVTMHAQMVLQQDRDDDDPTDRIFAVTMQWQRDYSRFEVTEMTVDPEPVGVQ